MEQVSQHSSAAVPTYNELACREESRGRTHHGVVNVVLSGLQMMVSSDFITLGKRDGL